VLTSGFEGLKVRPLPSHPPIIGGIGRLTFESGTFTAALDKGVVEATEGGTVDVAGTAITIRPGDGLRSSATVDLHAQGAMTAALSLLDQPPLRVLSSAGLPVALADGRAEAEGRVELFIGPMTQADLRYVVDATVTGARSDVLVPGWTLAADTLEVAATQDGIAVAGLATLGTARLDGAWRQALGPEADGRSTVVAQVGITPEVLADFGIVLPEGSVRGEGTGEMTVTLAPGEPLGFVFRSDLEGLRLAVPEIGWSKAPDRAGELLVEGSFGTPVQVNRLSLSAPGLSAEGDLRLTEAGAFDRLRLTELSVGDWLDAPVTLTAREGSDTPAVAVDGGSLDLAKAVFGGEEGGEGGPIMVELDRLQITEGIALTGFVGDFSTVAGLEGAFSGFVNDGPAVTGRVAPQAGRVAARIQGTTPGPCCGPRTFSPRPRAGRSTSSCRPRGKPATPARPGSPGCGCARRRSWLRSSTRRRWWDFSSSSAGRGSSSTRSRPTSASTRRR
jgi:hypothetical protein